MLIRGPDTRPQRAGLDQRPYFAHICVIVLNKKYPNKIAGFDSAEDNLSKL